MKIKSLHIQNFRGFEDVKIEFPDTNLAVFIGENGSGKSSVLDCVGILLVNYLNGVFDFTDYSNLYYEEEIKKNPNSSDFFELFTNPSGIVGSNNFVKDFKIKINDINLKSDDSKINFQLDYEGENILINANFNRNQHSSIVFEPEDWKKILGNKILDNPQSNLPILIYYQTNRVWQDNHKQIGQKEYKLIQLYAYEKAFGNSLDVFNDFFEWFKNQEDFENRENSRNKNKDYINPLLKVIRDAISKFFQNSIKTSFSNLRIETEIHSMLNAMAFGVNSSNSDIYLAISKNGETFRFEQLSSGEKMLMMMVADIARRLTIANPSLEGEAALQGAGIVLIDEIELHLHPSWQREVIPALRTTFPNIQFLITTHSPQVLSGIKKSDENSIFILKDFNIYKPSSNPIGRDSNGILEEIMGVSKRPQAIQDLIDNFFATLNKGLFEESEAIKESLATKLSFDDPFFIQAEATLKRKMILGK